MSNNKYKKVRIPLPLDYSPDFLRLKLQRLYEARFFKLFCSVFDFGDTVSAEERFVILRLLWEDGTFSITRSPAPQESFEKEMDLVFTKYEVDEYDFYLQPLTYHNVALKKAAAVSSNPITVGKTGVLVYVNEWTKLHPKRGIYITALNYIRQIVAAKMTIHTNLLLHKMPFLIPTDSENVDSYKDVIRQIFSDSPAVFVPLSMQGHDPNGIQTNTPYIIDKVDAYVTRLENMFLDEIGVDNVKPVQGGQDRLLLDESNANNAMINNFRESMFDTLNEGFEEAETLFNRKITVKPKAHEVASVHEDIRKDDETEPEEVEE